MIEQVCTTCHVVRPLRHMGGLITVNEGTTNEVRFEPDEFTSCPTCGNQLGLRIQTQPYELANHLDTPIARALYEQGQRQGPPSNG